MLFVTKVKEMQSLSESLRKTKTIGFVPTMGFLHEGHLSLIRTSKRMAEVTVVSIFVNPIQFGPQEDFERYPRDLERDKGILEKEQVDILFYPSVDEMYPEGYKTYVRVLEMEDYLCGRTRKGHFQGVATVVTKLFNIVKPHFAFFGEKDYQQLKIIERMVKDLNMDVNIIGCPVVRESDGLAMSSRNTYLSPEERQKAANIYVALREVQRLFLDGEKKAEKLIEAAHKILSSTSGLEIEYVEVVDTETLRKLSTVEDKALVALAVWIGKTRLIDNVILRRDRV
ncbi:MAG: pantoate--beta-alanine ligase [Desulfobacterota bacterium]|nr:pantoate--beta-alanine ligase [Thermodesulfobacteriota bacterium]MDW8001292.1 pantoate--beta-alanine ligase [Deltaproteobacteria bacterium]